MMIKVQNEFLDFNETIDVEKQIKLFEEISTTDGDFSYAFELPKTLHNTRLLNNPFPDNISKPVYQQIRAELLGESGAELYKGYLRIERVTKVYECSFFAGNNNWFVRISGLLADLDFSQYDVEQTEENIISSWEQNEGIVFPFLDNGGLITRSYPQLKIEDFVGAFYIKTIFKRIFSEAGIKIQGELLEDWHFNNAICIRSSKDQSEIDNRSAYVFKSGDQVIAHEVYTKITYSNDSTYPYSDGSLNLFDLPNSRYIPDVKMTLKVESTQTYHSTGFFGLFFVLVYVNGVYRRFKAVGAPHDVVVTNSFVFTINVEAGDIVEIYAFESNTDADAGTILGGGTVKFTPTYIYKTFGNAAVPNWTSQQFVSNVLRMFNVLPSFNAGDATLTLNIFEKIKSKPPIDLSEYLGEVDVDYSEFISDYAKQSKLGYQQVEFEELKNYNQGKFFKYGQGVLNVDNDFLEEDKEILLSDFANPVDYINPVFNASMGKTNTIEMEEGESVTFSDVANDGLGAAAFNISNEIFQVGDVARIKDSTNAGYNGDYVVDTVPSGHVTFTGIPFDTAASGTIVKLNFKYSNSDDVFIFLNAPNYPISNFAGSDVFFEAHPYPMQLTNVALAWFNMISTGRQVNLDFIYSIAFGRVDDPLAYQVPIIETHFRLFEQILNDPVKLIIEAHIPYSVFVRLDFLRPITIKTLETSNQYYLNRISGYQESYRPCTLELIKLASGVVERPSFESEPGEIPSGEGFPYIFDFILS